MESVDKNNICRLCLLELDYMVDIFEANDTADIIEDLLQLNVSESDGYPRVVCSTCLSKLNDFKLFKEQCRTAKDTYDNVFAPNEKIPVGNYNSDMVALETIKVEPVEDDEDDKKTMPGRQPMNEDLAQGIQEELDAISERRGNDSDCDGDEGADEVLLRRKRSAVNAAVESVKASTSGEQLSKRCRASTTSIGMKTECRHEDDVSDDNLVDDPVFWPDNLNADSDAGGSVTADNLYENPCSDLASECMSGNISMSDSDEDKPVQTPESKYMWVKKGRQPAFFKGAKFEEPYGPTLDLQNKSPLEIFSQFFSPPVWLHIVEQSNLYATQSGSDLSATVEEMRAFFGILIIMGFHKLPNMRLYWSRDQNFHVSRISEVMPQRRFLNLVRFLHVNDNMQIPEKGSPDYDKLYKLRPIITFLSEAYETAFNPSRCISVADSMSKYKGKNMMKPVKRGFKIRVAACAASGFMLAFEVHTSRWEVFHASSHVGESVVMNLVRSYRWLNYCIFFDDFFTSLPLLEKLLKKGFFGCGTMRETRRYFPKNDLKSDKDMKPGESDYVQSGDISVVKWMDRGKKLVCVASNMHDPTKTTTVQCTRKMGRREKIECPDAIAEYNKYIGGVDKFDLYMSRYSVGWKSARWWLRLFFYFLDSAIVNSYIQYQEDSKLRNEKKWMTQLEFHSQLANELIGNYVNRKRVDAFPGATGTQKKNTTLGQRFVAKMIRLSDVGSHMPEVGTRRRCTYCSTKVGQKRSTLCCKTCNVALCKGCFAPFHKAL